MKTWLEIIRWIFLLLCAACAVVFRDRVIHHLFAVVTPNTIVGMDSFGVEFVLRPLARLIVDLTIVAVGVRIAPRFPILVSIGLGIIVVISSWWLPVLLLRA